MNEYKVAQKQYYKDECNASDEESYAVNDGYYIVPLRLIPYSCKFISIKLNSILFHSTIKISFFERSTIFFLELFIMKKLNFAAIENCQERWNNNNQACKNKG